MHIGILTSSLEETNGWGRYTVNLVRALSDRGVTCTVFSESKERPAMFPAEVVPLRSRPGSGFKNVLRLVADVVQFRRRAKRFDAVHACTETHIFLSWLSGKPFVVSTHGTYMLRFLKHKYIHAVAARAFAAAGAVIVTSEFTYEKIRPYVHVRRTEQIPNGVNTGLFHEDTTVARNSHTFITVGAIKPRKGQDLGVRALSQLVKTYPDAKYCVVGKTESGTFRNRLDSLISELGLKSSVIFAGSPDDNELVRLYNEAAVFALPSRIDSSNSFEGYPLSLLEASACALPIIGSYGCGAEHLINNGENGYLIRPDDSDDLARVLDVFFSDPTLTRRMGLEAARIAAELSWNKNALRVIDIYRSIVNDRLLSHAK